MRRSPTLQHTLLAYQRAQEEQADRAGVRFLTMTGQSAKGMYDTFKRFADEMMFSAAYIDPYVQNHPMPAERMAALAELVKTPYWDKKDPPELQFRHDMMRAKLYGFTERSDAVMRRYPSSDTSMPARYARAISAYRFGDLRAALAADRQSDRGDAELSLFLRAQGSGAARKRARRGGDRAVAPRRPTRAQSGAHPDPAGAGADRDQQPQDGGTKRSRCCARRSLKEPESGDAYEQLAMAYGRNGDLADADLASAQAAFARGDNKTARELAARAKMRFPGRIAGLGAGRRHRRLQQEREAKPAEKWSITAKGQIMTSTHAWQF